jgi:hypothetical protein
MAVPSNIPDAWKTQHLFVLVGGNPLPNYVAVQLLLERGGTLHLLTSAGTAAIGRRIAELAHRSGCEFTAPPYDSLEDPGSRSAIVSFFEKQVKPLTGSIGLHYTGGTKAMAVHAFQELRKRYPQAVCTYLDARTLQMRHTEDPGCIPVGMAVQPSAVDLVLLHNIPLAYFVVGLDDQLVPLYQALAAAHATPAGQQAYDDWCRVTLRRGNGKLMEKRGHLPADGRLFYPTAPELAQVAEVMRAIFGIPGDAFDPEQVRQRLKLQRVLAKATPGMEQQILEFQPSVVEVLPLDELIRYLDGTWVEHLTFDAFRKVEPKYRPHDIAMSLKTKQTVNDPYDFEFDVAAMRGYQLYAVSCTRSNERSTCKSKLFEAAIRATQIGGEEAKVGLVCCDKDPQVLERQLQSLWRERKEEIRVFRLSPLAELTEKFYDWLHRSGERV